MPPAKLDELLQLDHVEHADVSLRRASAMYM